MSKCKPKTRFIPALCAWILLIGATALFFVFPCRYLTVSYQIAIPVWQGIITIFVVANFTLATFMDPGIIPKASKEEIKDDDFRVPLYKNVEINGIAVRMKWCTTCRFYRPPRCSHCSVCNICIETFDHHCPWVNNCIGRRNYRHFFMFLVSLSIHMMTIFAFCLVFLMDHTNQLESVDTIVCIAIMVIIFCLIFPILGLTGFHMVLVSRGRTTNEQVTGKFRGGYNPFSRGCCKNVGYTLCGPLYPRYTGRAKNRVPVTGTKNPISTIPMESQVRVYMDASNGVRVSNLNAYNKMSQGANLSDTELAMGTMDATQSQSRDCEATPPCPRNGSKTNLFDTADPRDAIRHPARCRDDASPTTKTYRGGFSSHQATTAGGARSCSPGRGRSPPTSPTRRSHPGTPGSPGSSKRRAGAVGYPYYQELRQRQEQLAAAAAAYSQASPDMARSVSPQRKFASESELTRPSESPGGLYLGGSNNRTSDNLLDASPTRVAPRAGAWRAEQHYTNVQPTAVHRYGGSPNWSHPTSPTATTGGRPPPFSHGRRSSGSTSPQPKRKVYGQNTSPAAVSTPHWGTARTTPSTTMAPWAASRRPMSFVKALEVSDSMETSLGREPSSGRPETDHRLGSLPTSGSEPDADRKSFYDTNYEISV